MKIVYILQIDIYHIKNREKTYASCTRRGFPSVLEWMPPLTKNNVTMIPLMNIVHYHDTVSYGNVMLIAMRWHNINAGIQYFLYLIFSRTLMYNWDLFQFRLANFTFYPTFDKMQCQYGHFLHTTLIYTTISWYTAVLTWAESITNKPDI